MQAHVRARPASVARVLLLTEATLTNVLEPKSERDRVSPPPYE